MDKVIAVKNFVTFSVPLSMLLICKIVLPSNMYESVVNFTADKIFMPPEGNRGMSIIDSRKFLMWTTSNFQSIKSTFSSMLLELGCTAHVGSTINDEIEFKEYFTMNSVKLSDIVVDDDKPIVLNIGSTS